MSDRVKKGRVLKVRCGINPNSSGHGILWGALFFMPFGAAAAILHWMIQSKLEALLKEYSGDDGDGNNGGNHGEE